MKCLYSPYYKYSSTSTGLSFLAPRFLLFFCLFAPPPPLPLGRLQLALSLTHYVNDFFCCARLLASPFFVCSFRPFRLIVSVSHHFIVCLVSSSPCLLVVLISSSRLFLSLSSYLSFRCQPMRVPNTEARITFPNQAL